MTKIKIAVLGTGSMGSALVRTFLEQGYGVAIWNRTRSKCEPLAVKGARIGETARAAIAEADLVIVNVNDYPTSDQLLRQDDVTKQLRGKTLVQLTTGTPAQARESAEWARQHQIPYLDGAIMNTPALVGKPGCNILYSGSRELFDKHEADLLALGGAARYAGADAGHASALDGALLAYMWGPLFSLLHAMSICDGEKVPLKTYAEAMKWWMPTIDFIVADTMERIQNRRFGDAQASIATCQLAVGHWAELCQVHGIRSGLPESFGEVFQAAIKAGRAKDDVAALYDFIKA